MIPNLDISFSHNAFPSEYVANQIIERLLWQPRADFEGLLTLSRGIGDLATVRGRLFGAHAHRLLTLGGDFETRDLQSGTRLPTI